MYKLMNGKKEIARVATIKALNNKIKKELFFSNDDYDGSLGDNVEDIRSELSYLHEELGYHLLIVEEVKNEEVKKIEEKPEIKTKTLKELKDEYGKELKGIKNFKDLQDLASNFIRMITWKKVKDLDFISNNYVGIKALIIKDILSNGFDESLATIKQNNLHKAYNLTYIYSYYGLDYKEEKARQKEALKNILENEKDGI